MLIILSFLAKKKIISHHILLGFTTVTIFLFVEPGGLNQWFLQWVILIPMFIIIKEIRSKVTLLLYGVWIGILIAIGMFSWLWDGLITLQNYSPITILPVFLILTFLLSLQFPLFSIFTRVFYERTSIPIGILGGLLYTFFEYWMPFPFYIHLSHSSSWMPLLIQIADLIGMSGITLLICLINGLLFTIFECWREKKTRQIMKYGVVLIIVLLFQISYGIFCLNKYKSSSFDLSLNVVMIQPVSPLKIMNADHKIKLQVADNLLRLSRKALSEASVKPDILVWPEGAGSFSYQKPDFNPEFSEAIKKLLQEYPIPILVQDIEFVKISESSKIGYFNHISLIDLNGNYFEGYRKNILLPFAEYLPGEKKFPFLRKLFPETRSTLSENKKTLINGPKASLVPLICYEIVFENFVRKFIKENKDAQYIVNLTNDRWYGVQQQPKQHLSFAVFRAIENRLPVVRCTNSGISAIIDARGIIRPEYRTNVMEETTLNGTIHPKSRQTFYCKFGDILPKFILTPLFILGLIYVYILGQKKKTL
jgi:apolipoprotein N-acyltransferase